MIRRSLAVQDAERLAESLLDHGVKAVAIDLVEGRGGSGWHSSRFVGSMGHHIVSRPSQGKTPFLSLVKNGRRDLPGPLCNGYGGFDEVARIICLGWANHPGRGGPVTVPAGTVPANNGRPYFFGWEFEGGLEAWADSMHDFMARCLAGTLDWLGEPVDGHVEHSTWTPRKIDRLDYSAEAARRLITQLWEDDDMAQFTDEDARTLRQIAGVIEDLDSSATSFRMWIEFVRDLRDRGITPEQAADLIGELDRIMPGGRRGWDAWAADTRKYAQAAGYVTKDSEADMLLSTEREMAFQMRQDLLMNPRKYWEICRKAGI